MLLCRGKRVAYEVLMGLHYLHGFKVVMLDLKSPNVLLAADGTAKLADVGLARLMSVTSLSHKIPTGTWAWAAPEALLGNKVLRPAPLQGSMSCFTHCRTAAVMLLLSKKAHSLQQNAKCAPSQP